MNPYGMKQWFVEMREF